MKPLSLLWALPVGLISVFWQVAAYYIRFGQFNPYSSFSDYIWFFISGSLGGLILVFFINQQFTQKGRLTVLSAFVLGTPVAMIFMVGGGLLGLAGILILPQIPWLIFSWIGSLLGKFLMKG